MSNLRVVTYNLYFGGRDQVEAIHDVLAQIKADVIALNEADDAEVVATLAQRLGLYHVWAQGSGDRHIATLSRFPVLEWHIYNRPPLTQAVLEIKVEFAPFGVEPMTVYNAHFLPYLLLPFEVRRWQAAGKLLRVIAERQPGPHLIVGDLNAIGPGDRVLQRLNPPRLRRVMAWQFFLIFRLAVPRLLRAGYVDCFRRLHPDEDGFTWMPGARTTRYDYILADAHFAQALRACRVVDDIAAVHTASDHFPLLAEFAWPSL
jgi:exonuclease III